MAHIFKHPKNQNKGIIIFSHKEWRAFSGNKLTRNLDRIPMLANRVDDSPRGFFRAVIEKIAKHYFIGVHFGGYQFRYQLDKSAFTTPYADFVLSVESTLPNLDSGIHRIPLNCRNFIPATFRDNQRQKQWDFVTVGRDVNFKNYPKLFESIKRVLSVDGNASFLLIVPSQIKMKAGAENSLVKLFSSTFSKTEQKQIAFLYLHPELDVGMNQNQLIKFYNLSKVFMLFSTQIETRFFTYGEGDSRVISEALCCGLPVVCSDSLKGGGKDFLNASNSVIFDDYEDSHLALLEARDKFSDGIKDAPEEITREDFTLNQLKQYFSEFYASKNQHFDGELINTDHLDVRIPSHYSHVPWSIDPLAPTSDLLSKQQFNLFMDELILKTS